MGYKHSKQKKRQQLGMDVGTASSQLKKQVMFAMAEALGRNICFQCDKKINSPAAFSLEHKVPWLDSDNPKELFFDLNNIAFSHLSCNVKAARQTKIRSHPNHNSYRNGCRCDECKEIERLRRQSQRKRGIKT